MDAKQKRKECKINMIEQNKSMCYNQRESRKEASKVIDLSNFKTFDFSEGVPYISITNNGITFNKSVIMKMKYPAYVKLLINEAEKQIAVQTCEEDDDKSVQFYKEKSNGVLSVRWNAKDLINTIARLCDWDLRQTSYRVNGVLVPELNLMLFDLNEAVTMV